jgi:hypothetical protein
LCAALVLGNAVSAHANTPAAVPAGAATAESAATAGSAASAPAGRVPRPSASVASSSAGEGDWTVRDAIRFWTPQRMASATDPAGRAAKPQGWKAPRVKRPAAGVEGEHFTGIKSVGVLFSMDKDMKAHYCTASVVHSSGHNLILTAGHCLGAKAAFVPMYDHTQSAAGQAYGMWPVQEWFRDARYASDKSPESDLDFAFARLQDTDGRNVEDVVGGNTLARTPGFVNQVSVIGYPSVTYDAQDLAIRCSGIGTTPLPSYNQMQIDCGGMWGGVSGGPWFSSVDPSSGTGEIIGSVGGFNGGGPDVSVNDPLYNRITYSPLHGDRFFQLYDDAQQGLHTDHGPYQQPPLAYSLGNAEKWKHAKLMAAGDFDDTGHSELIVVWDDGTVVLYTNDGNGRFVSERQLVASNTRWSQAATMTAGDFTGSNQFDLLVRWSDGEVTLYGDVGANGLDRAGTRMIAPNTTWRHAVQIAAGRFNASTYVTDLMVLWSDGELTLYTNVSAGDFGQEHTLALPKSVWQNARLLTGGEFSGGRKWDLMAQWSNGEIDTYVGTTLSAVGAKARVANPYGTWPAGTVLAVGDFTANGRTDDLVVHRPDGQTTMHVDTGTDHLGTGEDLVAPG